LHRLAAARILFGVRSVAAIATPDARCTAVPPELVQTRSGQTERTQSDSIGAAADDFAQVVVERDAALLASACKVRIFLDGQPVFELGTRERRELALRPGRYTVSAKPFGTYEDDTVSTACIAVDGAERKALQVTFREWGIQLNPAKP
jgi:hypothetical protein